MWLPGVCPVFILTELLILQCQPATNLGQLEGESGHV